MRVTLICCWWSSSARSARIRLRPMPMRAKHGLTQAEAGMLRLLVHGFSGKQIAAERGSSVHTVRAQLAAVYEKTGHHAQRSLLAALRRS